MKKGIFFLIGFFSCLSLLSKDCLAGAPIISSYPSEIILGDEFSLTATMSGLSANKVYHLRIALYRGGTRNYFGYTKDENDVWYNGDPSPIDYSKFLTITTDENGTWNGEVKGKAESVESNYESSEEIYQLKLGRYTETGTSAEWSDPPVEVKIISGQPPTSNLTLVKTVINDSGGNLAVEDFRLYIDDQPAISGVAYPVEASVEHTVSEDQVSGYSPSAWGGDCAGEGTITLAPGENKTCTITNDDIAEEDEEEEDNPFRITITHPDSTKAGEEFAITMGIENGKKEQEYYIKVRIRESTSQSFNSGETLFNGHWLSDNDRWTKFPKVKTDYNGNLSWDTIRARIKAGSNPGDYYFTVRIKEVGTEGDDCPTGCEDSDVKKITVNQAEPTSIPPTATPKPTATTRPTSTPKVSPTPSVSVIPTSAPGEGERGALLDRLGQVLGESEEATGSSGGTKKKVVAGGLIGLGGALMVGGGLLGKRKKKKQRAEAEEIDEEVNLEDEE